MADSVKAIAPERSPDTVSTGSTTPTSPYSGADTLTHQQRQQVREMIDQAEKHLGTQISAVEQRLEARLAQLPNRQDLQNLAREGRYWAIATVIGAIGVVLGLMAFGASQFGSGVQFTTGTVNYFSDAKKTAEDAKQTLEKAQEENAKQFRELRQLLLKMNQAQQAK